MGKYCGSCGKELKENEICSCQKKGIIKGTKNKKLPKSMILTGAAVVVVILIISIVLSTGTGKIDLETYINGQPRIIGLNGNAVIDINDLFDDSALESDIFEALAEKNAKKIDDMSNAELEALLLGSEGLVELDKVLDNIIITAWKDGEEVQELTGLSNGTKIKVEAKSQNPSNNYLKMNFKTGSVEFKVEGLIDGQEIDVFAETEMAVTFVGTEGRGKAVLNWNREALPELPKDFHVEYDENGCKNGSEIKVVLDFNASEWEALGYFPAEEFKTYTVEGLSSLVASMDEITENLLDQMKEKTEETLLSEAESEWRDGISIENMTYLGSYLLNKKADVMGLGSSNLLYLVYKVDAFENYAPDGGEDTHFCYYYYGCFEEVIRDPAGNIDLEASAFSVTSSSFNRKVCMGSSVLKSSVLVTYDGFESLEELFNKCVEAHEDKYTYVSTVKE